MTQLTPVQNFEHRQKVFAGLGLLILIFLSIILNSLHLNSVAVQNTKFISRMIQLQEFREIGLTLEDAKLDSFSEIHYLSDRPGRSFQLPASSELNEQPGFLESLATERVSVPTFNPLNPTDRDRIVFKYSRFKLVPYAVVIWLLIVLISIPQSRILKKRVVEQYENELGLERDRAQAVVAKEVRHNLRSPLAALMRIPGRLPESVKKDRELLESTIRQIRLLIARLGHEADPPLPDGSSDQIYDSLIQSVRQLALAIPPEIQFIRDIDERLVSALVPHVPHELLSLLGNVINNSVDAIKGNGFILFKARDLATDLEIEIQDSGYGIPADIIGRIFDGYSHGKQKGSGFGLKHAKRYIETWGGTIQATSNAGSMTKITIRLPIEDRASWYVPRIRVHQNQPVIVLDDQQSARDLWRIKLEEAGILTARVISSAEEFRQIAPSLSGSADGLKPIFFFDYDLGGGPTGMDLFESLPDDTEKYLVTGHFDDPKIRKRCESEKVYLIPKTDLPEIPIIVI